MKLIYRLDICHLTEHIHQFRQIVKLCKPRPRTVTRSLRRKLNRGHGLPKNRSPCVKIRQVLFSQRFILQIALHGKKLGHAVGYRCACGKYNAMPVCQFVHISALGEHIAGFLSFTC